MAGYAENFLGGFDRQLSAQRQQREQMLLRQIQMRQLRMAEAAAERAASRDAFERQKAQAEMDRQQYGDRLGELEAGTEQFKALNQSYPEAGAADEVSRVFQLNREIARQPNKLDPSLIGPRGVVEGPPRPGFDSPAPGGVTRASEREGLIGEAMGLFGKAKADEAALKHKRELQERAASRRAESGDTAYTRDLEIEQRGIDSLTRQVTMLESGFVVGPNNTWQYVNAMNDPKLRATQEAQIQRAKAQIAARMSRLQQLQQQVNGRVSVGGDPTTYYNTRRSQGATPEQIKLEMQQLGMPVQ